MEQAVLRLVFEEEHDCACLSPPTPGVTPFPPTRTPTQPHPHTHVHHTDRPPSTQIVHLLTLFLKKNMTVQGS